MKELTRTVVVTVIALLSVIFGSEVCTGQMTPGQTAPAFTLKDSKGKTHDLSQMRDQPMVILYFFDVESRPSQEGLLNLNQLAQQYKDTGFKVWAITLSSEGKVAEFAARSSLNFPVLLDHAGVSDQYQARQILPTVCIIGPGLKLLDVFQGGGKTTEIMLVRLAERELQRKQTKIAKAISEEVVKKNPQNVKAKTVKGYAALNAGEIKEAEQTFEGLSRESGQAEVLGKEGLAAVYAQKGQPEKALGLAREVERKAPERSYANVIAGNMLYAQNSKKEAQAEFEKAVKKKETEPYHAALGPNQLGRMQAMKGQYDSARQLYDQAVAIDPYYIEGTTNKGRTYEKEGKWDKALDSYRQAQSLDKSDPFAVTFAKKAQEMLDLQKDAARKERVDRLVKDLVERFRTQAKTKPKDEDLWTSRPMILSFVDFQEKGGLSQRDGMSALLTDQLGDHLNATQRVQVVERVLIERVLEELNLGSSDLADPDTALKLGKLFAAKLIGTGSLLNLPDGTLLSLRLIDSETSTIPLVTTRQLGPQFSSEKELYSLNREILKTVISKYPLRGYVVKVTGDQVMLNIGSKQGVVQGTRFDVLQEGEAIQYKGKTLTGSPKSIGQVEVAKVDTDLCFARIVNRERALKTDDKVQEKVDPAALGGKNVNP